MLRFDPTRADHTQFEEAKGKKRRNNTAADEVGKKRQRVDDGSGVGAELPPVSMEQFYEVRGDLKKTMGSGGFSLLSMFGRSADDAANRPKNAEAKPYEEKSIPKNTSKFLADLDPFKYDSSGDEAESAFKSKPNRSTSEINGQKSARIIHESFFIISASDERLTGKQTEASTLELDLIVCFCAF